MAEVQLSVVLDHNLSENLKKATNHHAIPIRALHPPFTSLAAKDSFKVTFKIKTLFLLRQEGKNQKTKPTTKKKYHVIINLMELRKTMDTSFCVHVDTDF